MPNRKKSDRVITKAVFDMRTGLLLEEESFPYEGEWELLAGEEPEVEEETEGREEDEVEGEEDAGIPAETMSAFLAELGRLQGTLQTPASTSKPNPSTAPQVIDQRTQVPPAAQLPWMQMKPEEMGLEIKDKSKFDNFMNSFGQTVRSQVTGDIPQMFNKAINEALDMREAAKDFWEANADLKPAKAFIASRASIIAAAEPNLPLIVAYERAGKEIRDSLKNLGYKGKGKTEGTPGIPRGGRTTPKSNGKGKKEDSNDVASLMARRMGLTQPKTKK